eukprot:TRINITY_DN2396_c0_g1_i3.p1 TRINITY_DN2396_c0_g1~~TRINITY_DN2396_c0_g1_i3.p1  ORF type:complete len:460 (+),score=90.28 TRINITY_DN2396_c0_g1_i3:806-2185(+)
MHFKSYFTQSRPWRWLFLVVISFRSCIQQIYKHLVSRDPKFFWTSGQWMTELTGGSDIGNSETIAKKQDDGSYKLYGLKYFTSAATSEIAVTLARIVDENGTSTNGSRGLTCFYLMTHEPCGKRLNNMTIRRLKDKLGTRSLPTAELELNGTTAVMVGDVGKGVSTISFLFNITRIYNAACAVSTMRRGFALAQDYATKRRAFGKALIDQPLHARTLANMETEIRGCLLMVLDVAHLLGRVECVKAAADADDGKLLRLLTPLCKLYTGKQAVALASETLECFGGTGYMEDTGLPRLLRDGQVLSIWEGTTNVLSLDVLRALMTGSELNILVQRTIARAGKSIPSSNQLLHRISITVQTHATAIPKLAAAVCHPTKPDQQANARDFAFRLTRIYIAGLLIEHALYTSTEQDREVARRWVDVYLSPYSPDSLPIHVGEDGSHDRMLATSGHSSVPPACSRL